MASFHDHNTTVDFVRAAIDSVPPPEGRWLLGMHPLSLATRLRRRTEMLDSARRHWEATLLINGHFFPALFSLGSLHHIIYNNTRVALQYYTRAFGLNPSNVFLRLYHKVAHAQEMKKMKRQWESGRKEALHAFRSENAQRLAEHQHRVAKSMTGLDIWT